MSRPGAAKHRFRVSHPLPRRIGPAWPTGVALEQMQILAEIAMPAIRRAA